MGFAVVPATCQLCGQLLLPETPRFLVAKGNEIEAANVLRAMNGQLDVSQQLVAIKEAIAADERLQIPRGPAALLLIWRSSHLRRGVLLGIMLMGIQQLSGINAVMYYSSTLLCARTGQACSHEFNCAIANSHDLGDP